MLTRAIVWHDCPDPPDLLDPRGTDSPIDSQFSSRRPLASRIVRRFARMRASEVDRIDARYLKRESAKILAYHAFSDAPCEPLPMKQSENYLVCLKIIDESSGFWNVELVNYKMFILEESVKSNIIYNLNKIDIKCSKFVESLRKDWKIGRESFYLGNIIIIKFLYVCTTCQTDCII